MSEKNTTGNAFLGREVEDNLRVAFDSLPNGIPIYFFTGKGQNDVLNKAGRELLSSFGKISGKIEFREFDLDSPEAKKWGVESSPTILFAPGRYSIRYLGVPYGEEGRTLVGIILLLGFRTSNLSEHAGRILRQARFQ